MKQIAQVWRIARTPDPVSRVWESSPDRTWAGLHEGFRRAAADAQADDASGISAGRIDHLHGAASRAEAAGEPAPGAVLDLLHLLDRHARR